MKRSKSADGLLAVGYRGARCRFRSEFGRTTKKPGGHRASVRAPPNSTARTSCRTWYEKQCRSRAQGPRRQAPHKILVSTNARSALDVRQGGRRDINLRSELVFPLVDVLRERARACDLRPATIKQASRKNIGISHGMDLLGLMRTTTRARAAFCLRQKKLGRAPRGGGEGQEHVP